MRKELRAMEIEPKTSVDVFRELLSLAAVNEPLVRYEKLGKGLFNSVYRLEFESSPPLILRIRKRAPDEHDMPFALEEQVCPLLPKTILVARARFVSRTFGFAVFDFIEGATLTQATEGCELFDGNLAERIGVLLAQLHSVRGLGFGDIRRCDYSPNQNIQYAKQLFMKSHRLFADCAPHLTATYERASSVWLDVIASTPPMLRFPTLLHGDVHAGNLIVTRDSAVTLIDWEGSTFGLTALDLARLKLSLDSAHPDWFSNIVQAYISAAGLQGYRVDLEALIAVFESFLRCYLVLLESRFRDPTSSHSLKDPGFHSIERCLDGWNP